MEETCKRLRELRESRGLTQLEVARAMGSNDYTNYGQYERGKRKPGYDVLIKLADIYDTSIDYIVGRTDDPERH